MQEFHIDIIREKLGKIHLFSQNIMDNSYPMCKNENGELRDLAQSANKEAYLIKVLTEQISGMLRS